jgi:hypothetical protein
MTSTQTDSGAWAVTELRSFSMLSSMTTFSGAKVVRDLGIKGAYQIEDGRGTRLVVVPRRGIVLPESGRTTDPLPFPYDWGCTGEEVFVGLRSE